MSIEEEYSDVLQNIKQAIIADYQDNPELIDSDVETAISYLVELYGAKAQGRISGYPKPEGNAAAVVKSVKQMCNWRLGKEKIKIEDESGQIFEIGLKELELERLEIPVIVDCLKKIQSSIKFWSEKHGKQGYLNYG